MVSQSMNDKRSDPEGATQSVLESELRYQLELEHLVASASSRLANVANADLDTAVNQVLADAGSFMGADRSYLFHIDDHLTVIDNTHEWCAPGIHSQIADLRNIPTTGFRWMLERLRGGDPLCLPHVEDLPPEAAAERQLMAQGHVQSVILVPARHGGRFTGLIGCDAVRGERRWSDLDVRLLRLLGEDIAGALARCRNDEVLRRMAREWQSTFDSVSDAIWLLDNDQHILRSNRAAATLFGKSIEEMLGRSCWEIVHGTDQPIPECPVVRMKRSRRREFMELAINGRWYQVVADPLTDPNGELRGAVHIVSDITERKRTEETLRGLTAELERRVDERTEALRDSEDRYRTLVEQIPAVTYTAAMDEPRATVFVSPQIEQMLGFTPAEYAADPDIRRRQLHPDDRDRVMREVGECHRTRLPLESEYRMLTRTGEVIWVRDSAVIMAGAPGKAPLLQGVMFDITAQKRNLDELAGQRKQLHALTSRLANAHEEERRRIAAGLHDEVGQLLVAGMLKLGEMRAAKNSRDRDRFGDEAEELMKNTADVIRELTFDLSTPTLQTLGFRAALEELCDYMSGKFGIRFEFTQRWRGARLPAGMRATLYRSVRELLMNVVKHAGAHRAQVHVERKGDRIRITVEDDGKGINASVSIQAVNRHGGFGLFSIREWLEDIYGTLSVNSIPEGGTRAVIEAPIRAGGIEEMRNEEEDTSCSG